MTCVQKWTHARVATMPGVALCNLRCHFYWYQPLSWVIRGGWDPQGSLACLYHLPERPCCLQSRNWAPGLRSLLEKLPVGAKGEDSFSVRVKKEGKELNPKELTSGWTVDKQEGTFLCHQPYFFGNKNCFSRNNFSIQQEKVLSWDNSLVS